MAYELRRVADLNDDAKAAGVFSEFLKADVEERERETIEGEDEAAARAKSALESKHFVEASREPARPALGHLWDELRGDAQKITKSTGIVMRGDDAVHVARLTGTPHRPTSWRRPSPCAALRVLVAGSRIH